MCLNSGFASLVGIPIGIRSAVGLKNWDITNAIKKYKLIITEKEKKRNIIVLLAQNKLSSMKNLIFRDLIKSYVSYQEFLQANNILRKSGAKKETKKSKMLNSLWKIVIYL